MPGSRTVLTFGLLLIGFGLLVLGLVEEVPDRSHLTQVTGQLKSLEKVTSKGGSLSAIRFSLTTDPRRFQYVSKAGQIDSGWSALGQVGRAEISVLFDPAGSHSPPLDGRAFRTVFEVKVGDRTIRPHAEVAQSWRADNFVGVGLGYGTAVVGIVLLLFYAWRRYGA